MTVSEYITDFLVSKGIKDVFFVDGSAIAHTLVAISNNKKLKYYCPLHEQAGAFMVDGYYKASHRMSAMFATSGPGGQNLLNGIAASFYDSIPVMYFTGQVNSRFIKPNKFLRQRGFQEHDMVASLQSSTKYSVMVTDPNVIKYQLEKAYHIAISGRPGPVHIDLPMDIQRADVEPNMLNGYYTNSKIVHDINKIPEVLRLMRESRRPAILIGGGVWLSNAVDDVKQLVRKLKKVPVFVTWNMIDYFDPKYDGGKVGTFGGDGRNFGIQNCDFLLIIGSRLSGRITGGMVHTFARGAKKIMVNIDDIEISYQTIPCDLNICCDAKIFINEFINCINDSRNYFRIENCFDNDWLTKVQTYKTKYPIIKKEYYDQRYNVNPYVFMDKLNQYMKDDILVIEAGGNCVIASQSYQPKEGQRVFSNNGNSSLGYALPAAIGAAIATKKNVNCIVGDGGINFNLQELQTLRRLNLPVKILIFNNRSFGITKLYRDTHFNSNYAGVDAEHGLSFPNYSKIAKAYGIRYVVINNHRSFDRLAHVLSASCPMICNINMIGFYDYKPRLGWGTPIEDQYPFLPREEFRQNMIIEPHESWKDPQYPGPVK